MVMEMLNNLNEEVIVDDYDKEIEVEVNDWEGFDENWEEIMRDYDEEAVEAVYNIFKNACKAYKNDGLYEYFIFEGFQICWGYASYNI